MAMDMGKDAAKTALIVSKAQRSTKLESRVGEAQILEDAYAIAFAELTTLQELLIRSRRTQTKDSFERLTLCWLELVDTMEYYFEVKEEFEDGR